MELRIENGTANTEYLSCDVESAMCEILGIKFQELKYKELINVWAEADNMSGRELITNYWTEKSKDFQIAKIVEGDDHCFLVIDNVNNRAFLPVL